MSSINDQKNSIIRKINKSSSAASFSQNINSSKTSSSGVSENSQTGKQSNGRKGCGCSRKRKG